MVPPFGPISGNITVKITGGPFKDTDELRCKFGDLVVQALFVDNGMIYCYAPPYNHGTYPLEVSLNDQDYTTLRVPFFYYVDPMMSRISPLAGNFHVLSNLLLIYICKLHWNPQAPREREEH